MKLRPDFVVLAPDLPEVRLVVEVKLVLDPNSENICQPLKDYMAAHQCPTGLLVTSTHSWFLHDTYDTDAPASIKSSAPLSTRDLLSVDEVPGDERSLQNLVESWLERLTSGSAKVVREPVREEVSSHLLTAAADGRVASGRLG